MKHLRKTVSVLMAIALLAGMISCASETAQQAVNDTVQTADTLMTNQNLYDGNTVPTDSGAMDDSSNDTRQDEVIAEAEMAAAMASSAAAEASKAAADAAASYSMMAAASMALGMPQITMPEESYGKLIENSFMRTTENNVSTFSADVDTASYTYFRKVMSYNWKLNEIVRQAGTSIRTEEMINYFDYDYQNPGEGELFGVKTQIAPCPWNEQAVLLQLGLKADDAVNTQGNNLVFLIDVSGSMRSEDKLPLLKTAFNYLTETLTSEDVVSIVTYSGQESVVLEGCKGTYTDQILKAVNTLSANGSTNGQAGLQRAYEIAAKYYIEGGNNRIIMASDGDLNVGIRSPEELKNFISEKRDAGIYLSVLGFGTGNYRDANMEALADHGNGVYYYIDGASEAEKVFGDDLLSTLYTVAEDVKMQITFDPQFVAEYRLVGYENRLLNEEDFENDKKDAGEVGAGHTLTVCYELVLTEAAQHPTAEMNLMKLAIRHKAPGEEISQLNEYTVSGASYTETPDDDFKFICAVAELSMILHQSEYTDINSIADIYDVLNSLPLSNDLYKAEFRDMVAKLAKAS